MHNFAPILYFAFNRPEHTRKSMESICANKLASQSDFFAFVDGPRNESEVNLVNQVIKIIQSYKSSFKTFNLQQNSENLGCDKQILTHLKKYCDQFDEFVYLEDDIIIGQQFLSFMNEGLIKYRLNPNVKSIAGFVPNLVDAPKDCYFLQSFSTWGFASWSRVIKDCKFDGDTIYRCIKKNRLKKTLTFNGSTYSWELLKKHLKNPNVIVWDILLHANILLQKGFTLYPPKSLSKNIGLDGSGENFNFIASKYMVDIVDNQHLKFPNKVSQSQQAYQAYVTFYNRHKLSVIGHIKSKSKKIYNYIIKGK